VGRFLAGETVEVEIGEDGIIGIFHRGVLIATHARRRSHENRLSHYHKKWTNEWGQVSGAGWASRGPNPDRGQIAGATPPRSESERRAQGRRRGARGDREMCFTISEKARALGGSALETILMRFNS